MTIEDRSPEALRGLKLEIFWDGAATPAVSVPLGDFFLHGAGEMVPMETALLASPEGRSFVSYMPMPFRHGRADRRHQRVRQAGQSDLLRRQLPRAAQPAGRRALFPRLVEPRPRDRARPGLPDPAAHRRAAAGSSAPASPCSPTRSTKRPGGARARSRSRSTATATTRRPWSAPAPRIISAPPGARAPISTAIQGAPIATWDGDGRWTFYRFHVPDPIFFDRDIEVALQQIGGARKNIVLGLQKKGAPLIPVTIDPGSRNNFQQLLTKTRQAASRSVAARRPHQLLPQRRCCGGRLFLSRPARRRAAADRSRGGADGGDQEAAGEKIRAAPKAGTALQSRGRPRLSSGSGAARDREDPLEILAVPRGRSPPFPPANSR